MGTWFIQGNKLLFCSKENNRHDNALVFLSLRLQKILEINFEIGMMKLSTKMIMLHVTSGMMLKGGYSGSVHIHTSLKLPWPSLNYTAVC